MGTINAFNNAIADAKTAITLNAGTNTISIGSDAAANTINLATGVAVKSLTVGSTNTTSSTAIKSGTGNIAMNSGLTVDSTGRNYNTKQPCFMATNNDNQTDVTGDATEYVVQFANEIYDQNNDFDGTSTFTAPITGKYELGFMFYLNGITSSMTNNLVYMTTTAATYRFQQFAPYTITVGGGIIVMYGSTMANMTAGDTATVTVRFIGGTKVVDVVGATSSGFRTPIFWGNLIC